MSCLKGKQLTVADFPDHIHNLKQKNPFVVNKHGCTKLFLPKNLVLKYNSDSKEFKKDVETEAMKAVREKKFEQQQQQKSAKKQNIQEDQQKLDLVGNDTWKQLKKAGINSKELASLAKEQQQYENKQKKESAKGNKEMLEHQRRVKEAQEILKLEDPTAIDASILDIEKQKKLLEEAAHNKVKDSTNTDTIVGNVQPKGNCKYYINKC